jgi:DNA-binding protein HU-beta
MTRTELVEAYREATGLSKKQAAEYLDRLGDIMATELLGGGEAPLPGIGNLAVREVAARKGRNPRTGEPITIPAGRKVVLKVGKSMREALRDGGE